MYTIKTNAEFISDLRLLDERLKNIKLSAIEIDKKEYKIRYNFICDQVVDGDLQQKILKEAEKISSPIFSVVEVSVKKIVSNDQLINIEIYKFLKDNCPAISVFLTQNDVISSVVGNLVKYTLRLTEDGAEYVSKNGALNRLNNHLSKLFCSDFAGNVEVKEKSETLSLLNEEVFEDELQKIEHRTIRVKDVVVIDDAYMGDLALYIEDATSGDVTICGTVTDIREKETKNGKPFLVINLDDTTGRTSGLYFAKKSTYHKIKEITVGEAIIARGRISDYNGRRSFTFDKINRCTFPTDFVKKEKYKKKAPREYRNIFPTPAKAKVKVKSVFDAEEILPAELTEKTYVVFDIETTGLDHLKEGITEIGAVKLVGGKMTEEFSTLVKPDYPITEENAAITGITEDMVKDAPKIDAVMPDFMKFIDGAILVGHNALSFDMKFIKRFAGGLEYEVKNQVIDSLDLARQTLPTLKKHDLQTLADHFGIVFHHHRATPDAYTTAEVLIELLKIKNGL